MNARQGHAAQGVYVFVLLGLFAVLSTLMVLLGAQMYRATVDSTQRNNEDRVMGAYVRSMVRAMDGAGGVSVEKLGDVTALGLRETFDDEVYVTWIYLYDGQLWEQFTELENAFEPESGTPICPAHYFVPRLEDGLLKVFMTDLNDRAFTATVALRCA